MDKADGATKPAKHRPRTQAENFGVAKTALTPHSIKPLKLLPSQTKTPRTGIRKT